MTTCGEFEGCWRPPWSPVELVESLEPLPVSELCPVFEFCVVPLVPGTVAAWLDPGRTAMMAPAAATLATATPTVAALSRRRPSSRSATA
jgi:hypothetical protein